MQTHKMVTSPQNIFQNIGNTLQLQLLFSTSYPEQTTSWYPKQKHVGNMQVSLNTFWSPPVKVVLRLFPCSAHHHMISQTHSDVSALDSFHAFLSFEFDLFCRIPGQKEWPPNSEASSVGGFLQLIMCRSPNICSLNYAPHCDWSAPVNWTKTGRHTSKTKSWNSSRIPFKRDWIEYSSQKTCCTGNPSHYLQDS